MGKAGVTALPIPSPAHLTPSLISCFFRRARGCRQKALVSPPARGFLGAGWDHCGAVGAGGPQTTSGPPEARFLGEAEAVGHQTYTRSMTPPPQHGPCHRVSLGTVCMFWGWGGVQGRAQQGEAHTGTPRLSLMRAEGAGGPQLCLCPFSRGSASWRVGASLA